MLRYLTFCLVCVLTVGCTNYNYIVTDSTHLSQRVSDGTMTTLKIDPLIYGMLVKENRLVLTIKNTLPDSVELLGAKSTVVDQHGQSHPLRSQTIAPNAFIKLILPPLRPRFETTPSSGLMFGAQSRADSSPHPDPAAATPPSAPLTADTPIYLDYFSDTDAYYWDFDGEGEIRLLLTYQKADGKVWTDQFTIYRQKA